MSTAISLVRPYIGLRYFKERDAHLYFGRDEHVTELIGKLAQHRFVAVMGSSGSGKSSLVRAGLLPELRSGMIPNAGPIWKVVEFRPAGAPLRELSNSLRATLHLDNAGEFVEQGPLGVVRAVAEASLEDRTNILVIADQFEEVFRFQREEATHGRRAEAVEECHALVRRLLDSAAQPELSIYVLLVIRSEYLGECSQFPDLPECMSESLYLVPRLRRNQLQQAITAPVGGGIEPAVVQRLLRDVGSDPDQLPRLQHLLARMWERCGAGELTMRHYDEVGGWDQALEQHLESVRQRLDDHLQDVCRRVFQQLGELDKGQAVRRRVPIKELIDVCGPGALDVVGAFRAEGFLGAQDDLVDVTHECILREWPLLREWLEAEQQSSKRLRELTEATRDAGWQTDMDPRQQETLLGLTGLPLHALSSWRAEARPTAAWARRYSTPVDFDTADDYLTWSQGRDKHQKRRVTRVKRLLTVLFAVLFLGMVGTTSQLYRQKIAAVAKERTNYAVLSQATDPALALYLGYAAAEGARSLPPALESVFATSMTNGASYGVFRGNSAIYRLAWSPDRRTLASANLNGTIGLWEVASGQLLRTLEGHLGPVYSVGWSHDGTMLASAGRDGTIWLWEVVSGRPLGTLRGHQNSVWSVAWSPDGKILASAGIDSTIRLWEVASWHPLRTLQGHQKSVYGLAWRPDGKMLASASGDLTIGLWDVESGQLLRRLHGHEIAVDGVAWSPDRKTLASAGADRTVRLWDVNNGQLLHTLQGHQNFVRGVAWRPDGKMLASASYDGTIKLWEVSGQLVRTLQGHQGRLSSVVWSGDGTTLASASSDDWTIRLWDMESGQSLRTLQGHQAPVSNAAWSPDGKIVASASQDQTIRLWGVGSGQTLRTLEGHQAAVRSLAWKSDGKLLASSSLDGTIILWEVDGGRPLRTLRGTQNSVYEVAWSPDGKWLASAGGDQTIHIWDVGSGQTLRVLRGHGASIRSVKWRSDGKLLASSSVDRTIRLWEVASGQMLRTLAGHQLAVWSVAWSPDGQTLASASHDRNIRLWNVESGQLLRTLQGHQTAVWSVTWSPDGKTLASGGEDDTVRIWQVANGHPLRTFRGHHADVWSVTWSPDGKTLASGSRDGTVRLWPGTVGGLLDQVRHAIRLYTPSSSECLQYFGSEKCEVAR